MCLGSIDGDTAVVAHVSVSAAGVVEKRGLSAVRIAHERHVDGSAFLPGSVLQVVILMECRVKSEE